MPDLDQLPEAELLASIRDFFDAVDRVPDTVLAAARGCLVWRTVDAELAELVEDSALQPAPGVRGAHAPRLLIFTAPATSVVVEVAEIGARRRLVGQLGEPRPAAIEIRSRDGATSVDADTLGRFVAESVPAGPVSLVCRFAAGDSTPIVTDWVTL